MTFEQKQRDGGLDALRGFIMVLMALDHARTFLCASPGGYEIWVGRFIHYHGDLFAFLTRFVSHLSAPGFFFLMGCSMVLFSLSRKDSGWDGSRIFMHFIKRGLLLIGLQFLVENTAWTLGFGQMPVYFGVLSALGSAMVLGALMLELSLVHLLVSGLLLVAATEVLLPQAAGYVLYPLHLRLMILPGFTPGAGALVLYPVLPWLGVALCGMAFGKYLAAPGKRYPNFLLYLGIALVGLFFVVRANQGFGNIRMPVETGLIGFFNVVKYPPSLAFLLLTLGINLMVLRGFHFLEKRAGHLILPLAVLGRVPLFFYLLHLFLYAVMGRIVGPDKISLGPMYGLWMLGLLILFPLCLFYARKKQQSRLKSWLRLV